MLSLILIILLLLVYLIIYNCRKSKNKITEKKTLNCICEDQILTRDNNIPGILPGGIPGDTLGLENNPELNLFTPLQNPLLCGTKCNLKCKYESNISRKKRGELLDKCICASSKKYISDDLPPSLYQKYKFHTCNPYNGSYCQCTNNYLPLPPHKNNVKPSLFHQNTKRYLEQQFGKL